MVYKKMLTAIFCFWTNNNIALTQLYRTVCDLQAVRQSFAERVPYRQVAPYVLLKLS